MKGKLQLEMVNLAMDKGLVSENQSGGCSFDPNQNGFNVLDYISGEK